MKENELPGMKQEVIEITFPEPWYPYKTQSEIVAEAKLKYEQWHWIEGEVPDHVHEVLCFGTCCDMPYHAVAFYEDGDFWMSQTGERISFKVTHWRELDEPIQEYNTKD